MTDEKEDLRGLSVMNKLFWVLALVEDNPEAKRFIESVIDDLDRLKPFFNNPIPPEPSGRKSYGGET